MLQQFLLEIAKTEFVWGETDCAMTIANWWRRKHGIDPGADLRGTYVTEGECRLVMEREGGILEVVRSRAERAGAVRTAEPEAGDIGIIRLDGIGYAAIRGPSGRWMVKSPHGLAGYRCGFFCAWRS